MIVKLKQNRKNAHYPITYNNTLYLKASGKTIWYPIYGSNCIIHTGWVNNNDFNLYIKAHPFLLQRGVILSNNVISPHKEINVLFEYNTDYSLIISGGDEIAIIENVDEIFVEPYVI